MKVSRQVTRTELEQAIEECVRRGLLAKGSTLERLVIPKEVATRGRR